MKFMLLTILFAAHLQAPAAEELLKLADRLSILPAVAYDYQRDLHYASDGYKHTLKARVHIVFDAKLKPLGAIYAAKGDDFTERFDGFQWLHRGKTTSTFTSPRNEFLESIACLKNSWVGLARSLREIAKDSHSKISFDKAAGRFTVTLKELEFGLTKALLSVEYSPTYEITLEPKSMLPAKIVHKLANRGDTITTTFEKVDLEAKPTLPF